MKTYPDCIGHVFQFSDHVSVRAIGTTPKVRRDCLHPKQRVLFKRLLQLLQIINLWIGNVYLDKNQFW